MSHLNRISRIVEELYSIIIDIDNYSEVETEAEARKITTMRENLKEVIYKLCQDHNLTGIKITQLLASLGYTTYESLTYA
tara:strand:- start:343 stop:582 length:240 start_codon:yes stop_codon:yes gene_type:complete